MAKYSEKLVEKIVILIEEGDYTISEICNILSVSRKSFYQWKDSKKEFAQALDEAQDRRDEKLIVRARKSLRKKIDGYMLTETKMIYIPDKNDPTQLRLKQKVVKQKEYAPDNSAITLVLKHDSIKFNSNTPSQICEDETLKIIVSNSETMEEIRLLQKRVS